MPNFLCHILTQSPSWTRKSKLKQRQHPPFQNEVIDVRFQGSLLCPCQQFQWTLKEAEKLYMNSVNDKDQEKNPIGIITETAWETYYSDHIASWLTSQCSLIQMLWTAVTWQNSVCGFIMCFIEGYVFMDREDCQYWTKQVWQIPYKHFRVYLMLFHRYNILGIILNFSYMPRFPVYLKTVYFISAVVNACMTESKFLSSQGQHFPQGTELCLWHWNQELHLPPC